jgi:hypothetical protein
VNRLLMVTVLMTGLSLGACGAESVRGSGNVTSERRDVGGFNEVELRGIGDLTVRQTGSESLTVEAEDNIIPVLKTEVENNRLTIGVEDNTAIQTTKPINYELTVKDLNALILSGSGNIDAADISTDELGVVLSGSGGVKAAGKADSQDVDISGSGSYRAENLESEKARVELDGSGTATVNVSDRLDARIRGSGSVEYYGDPTVSQDVSGSGRVRKR